MTRTKQKPFTRAMIGILVGVALVLASCSSNASTSTGQNGQGLPLPSSYRWGDIMAGSVIASLPVVIMYYVSQRLVVEGLTSVAVKG